MSKSKIVILLGLMLLALTACGKEKTTETAKVSEDKFLYKDALKETEKEEYKTATVTKGDFVSSVFTSGEIQYLDTTALKMDATNATFTGFKVEEGDKVKKGDVIATFSVEEDEVYMTQQTMQVENAEAEFASSVKRKKSEIDEKKYNINLMADGSEKEIAKAELKKLEMDYKEFLKTESTIKEQRQTLEDYKKELKRTKVYAEASGEVLKVEEIAEGDTVANGAALVTVSKKKDFLIKVENKEKNMRFNMEVKVLLGSSKNNIETEMTGRVIGCTNYLDASEQNDEVFVTVENPPEDANWKKNIFIEYDAANIKDVLLVPVDAVMTEAEGGISLGDNKMNRAFGGDAGAQVTKPYVTILDNGVMKKRYIITSNSNNEYYLALQGVKEGDVLMLNK